MLSQYNKNLRFRDYQPGEKVWLKSNFIKSGENKLGPKRNGPWTVIQKMPNGVNFRIRNEKTRVTKIVHHDILKAIRGNVADTGVRERLRNSEEDVADQTSSTSSAEHSDYSPSESSSGDSETEPDEHRRYPMRHRQQRLVPGGIPWDAIQL